MRCFIAIDLPNEAKKELNRIQEEISKLANEKSKLKFVEPKNLHLTLKFLGELSDAEVNKIKETLRNIKFEKFSAKLSGIGVFPSPSYIRVVWVGLQPAQLLKELHDKIDSALAGIAIKREKRFESHITLARVKAIKDKAVFVKQLQAIEVKPIEFAVNSFTLKKSTLTKAGPIYADILKFEL